MRFLVLPHSGRGVAAPDKDCPTGHYETYFSPGNLGPCFRQVGLVDGAGGTIGRVLRIAGQVGLRVHLGLLLPPRGQYFWVPHYHNQTVGTKGWAQQQVQVVRTLHKLYAADHLPVAGIYTEVEESNSASWRERFPVFATEYLGYLASTVKAEWSSALIVWASPYSIGNLTRHPPPAYTPPATYRDTWRKVFDAAGDMDLAAPQDSMGAQGNSFKNASDYLLAGKLNFD